MRQRGVGDGLLGEAGVWVWRTLARDSGLLLATRDLVANSDVEVPLPIARCSPLYEQIVTKVEM